MSRSLARKCVRGLALAALVVLILDANRGRLPAQVRSKFKISAMPTPDASAAFSPDGSLLATAGVTMGPGQSASQVRVWDTASGKLLWKQCTCHSATPRELPPVFSPDGKLVAVPVPAADGLKCSIELIDSRKGVTVVSLPGYSTPPMLRQAFAPDGKTLVTASIDLPAREEVIRLEDVATGATRKSIPAGKGRLISQIAIAPDGRTLATVSGGKFQQVPVMGGRGRPAIGMVGGAGIQDVEIRLWDLPNGNPRAVLKATGLCQPSVGAPTVHFAPDGTLVTPGPRGVAVWDTARAKLRRIIRPAGMAVPIPLGIEGLSSVGFLADEHAVVVGLGNPLTISLCNLKTGKSRRTLTRGPNYPGIAVVVSPRGHLAVSDEVNSATLWDAQHGRALVKLPGVGTGKLSFGGPGPSLFFAPDESALAGIGVDGTVIVWDLKRWLPKATPEPQAAEEDMGANTDNTGTAHELRTNGKPAPAVKPAPPRFRTWVSADGRFTVEARLAKVESDAVVLKKRSGKEVKVPLDKLSEEDRAYVEQRAHGKVDAPQRPGP